MRNSQIPQDERRTAKGVQLQPLDDVGLPLLDDGQPGVDAENISDMPSTPGTR